MAQSVDQSRAKARACRVLLIDRDLMHRRIRCRRMMMMLLDPEASSFRRPKTSKELQSQSINPTNGSIECL